MFIEQKASNHIPNPDRCIFVDTGLCLKNCKEISLSLFQRAVAIELVTRQRPAGSLARQAFAPTA